MARGPRGLLQTFRIGFSQLPYLFIFPVFFSPHAPILACGTIDDWIAVYARGETHKALLHMLDCADSYETPADDVALLPVILDALESSREVAAAAERVFLHFNHLWGARHEPAYPKVLKAIMGLDDSEGLSEYRDWMVVTAVAGANMRDGPSLDSPVVTAVKHGMHVKTLSKQGDWVKVRPVGPGSVDRRFERKIGWIHETLLKPY